MDICDTRRLNTSALPAWILVPPWKRHAVARRNKRICWRGMTPSYAGVRLRMLPPLAQRLSRIPCPAFPLCPVLNYAENPTLSAQALITHLLHPASYGSSSPPLCQEPQHYELPASVTSQHPSRQALFFAPTPARGFQPSLRAQPKHLLRTNYGPNPKTALAPFPKERFFPPALPPLVFEAHLLSFSSTMAVIRLPCCSPEKNP